MYRATIRDMSNSHPNHRQAVLEKIRRASRVLRWVFLFVGLIWMPMQVIGWLLYERVLGIDGQVFLDMVGLKIDLSLLAHTIDWQQRLLAIFASALPTALNVASFVTLARLFQLYGQGQIFTAQVVATIRKLGFLIVGSQFADLIYQALSSIALTLHNGVGHRQVTVRFSSDHIEMLLVAAVVIFGSWVMDEGRRIQAELDLTI